MKARQYDHVRSFLDRGHTFCTLYTGLANPTSNRIYMRIGYQPTEDAIVYEFK